MCGITQEHINIIRKHCRIRGNHLDFIDEDDLESHAMRSMVIRERNYNGVNQFSPYLIHYVKKDVTDYLRTAYSKHIAKLDISEAINISFLDYRPDTELVEWVDKEAGFPMGTWFSQGYKNKEVAEKAGFTPAYISQLRKELYARAKRLRKIY